MFHRSGCVRRSQLHTVLCRYPARYAFLRTAARLMKNWGQAAPFRRHGGYAPCLGLSAITLLAAAALAFGSSHPALGLRPDAAAAPGNAAAAVDKGNATHIRIDEGAPGRAFGGVGAISAGGNSRLLIDYPAKQRNQILDYLFKPGYGASLQILKIEIGGDANSTDGAEPSIEHTRGVVNCNAGYEFWLAQQAKLRNPAIKLYGLAWAAPGWIGDHHFWSHDMVNYLMTWLDCAHSQGLAIDYLGGWNERGYNAAWFEELHAALASRHSATQIVADDSGWKVADAMAADPAFAKSVDIIGVHYSCEGGDGGSADSCHSTQNALGSGKPLWDSEGGSQDENTGAGPLIRAITRGYIDAKMTGFLNWPPIAAISPNLPYQTTGLMVASQPWSGNYSIGQSLWAVAQITQFTQPGWIFLDDASGYLNNDRTRGSYISLRSPDGSNETTLVETTTAASPSQLSVTVSGSTRNEPIQVWTTDLRTATPENAFHKVATLRPDSSGSFQFPLEPDSIYTFSTLDNAGHGSAQAPASQPLKFPYREDLNNYHDGQEARYLSDMQGAFEVQPCEPGRSGKCLQQMAPVKPIEWQDDSDAFTLLGDPTWSNYTVSVDAELSKPGTIELIGRAGTQKRPQSHQQGYYFQVSDTGAWVLLKGDAEGNRTVLAHGSTKRLGIRRWHRLSMSLNGPVISPGIDGKAVATFSDHSYSEGQIGLGVIGYMTDQFDRLSVVPPAHTFHHAR